MGIVDSWHGSANKPSIPRFRSMGSLTGIAAGNRTTDATCSSGTTDQSYGTIADFGETQQTWDSVTPDFHRRSMRGEIISNPFRTLKEFHTCSGNYAQVIGVANSCNSPVKHAVVDLYGPQAYWRMANDARVLSANSLVSDSDIKSATTVASTAAYKKSNSHDADTLIDIAEMKQTLRMFRDPIQSSSSFLRKINAGKRGIKNLSSQDAIAYANGLWLQYRYGIRPLVSSVQGVIKALNKIRSKKRHTYRGSYRLKSAQSTTGSYITAGSLVNFNYAFTYSDEVLIRTGLLVEDDITLSQELGVDASGLLALPWELVPFSFVADWFANVGDYFNSIVPALTLSPLSTWTSTVRRRSTIFTVTSTSAVAGWTVQRDVNENRSAVFEEKTRYPTLSLPSITFKPRPIESITSDLRIVDAWALLHQQFMKVFKP